MALFKRGDIWWYEFLFARRRVRESAKTTSKTVARLAEQKRRRELEEGFNGFEDTREERIRKVSEIADEYLANYRLRHKSITFARHAVCNVKRHLGTVMVVDITEKTVTDYQTMRLKKPRRQRRSTRKSGFFSDC
jgi:hypothetical protein